MTETSPGAGQAFGGDWTEKKLEVVERYLDAYTTALKDQIFQLIYIDAFAGAGDISIGLDGGDGRKLLRGSVSRALGVEDKPFDRLVLVEQDPMCFQELVALRKEHQNRDILLKKDDANAVLQGLPPRWSGWRGVLFLDPCGTQVDWRTLEAVRATEALDTWILFPVGAIRRLLPRWKMPDQVSDAWADRLDRIYGGDDWRAVYEVSEARSLFGEERSRSSSGIDKLLDIYRTRLGSLFGDRFLTKSATLCNYQGSPLFELLFVAGNPRGAPVAKRIAEHLLREI